MKKIKGNALVTVIIILALVALIALAVLYFFRKGGLGFGIGSGDGIGKENAEIALETTVSSETGVTAETITKKELKYIDVTVHENSYIYNSNSYEFDEIDELINEICKTDSSFEVHLHDDNASYKAYTELEKALHEKNINCTDKLKIPSPRS